MSRMQKDVNDTHVLTAVKETLLDCEKKLGEIIRGPFDQVLLSNGFEHNSSIRNNNSFCIYPDYEEMEAYFYYLQPSSGIGVVISYDLDWRTVEVECYDDKTGFSDIWNNDRDFSEFAGWLGSCAEEIQEIRKDECA